MGTNMSAKDDNTEASVIFNIKKDGLCSGIPGFLSSQRVELFGLILTILTLWPDKKVYIYNNPKQILKTLENLKKTKFLFLN